VDIKSIYSKAYNGKLGAAVMLAWYAGCLSVSFARVGVYDQPESPKGPVAEAAQVEKYEKEIATLADREKELAMREYLLKGADALPLIFGKEIPEGKVEELSRSIPEERESIRAAAGAVARSITIDSALGEAKTRDLIKSFAEKTQTTLPEWFAT
jgi:hypothetical protein